MFRWFRDLATLGPAVSEFFPLLPESQSMDARLLSSCVAVVLSLLFVDSLVLAAGTDVRTENFIVRNAPTHEFARQVGQEAERFRRELANQWLGRELPSWSSPCTLTVVAGNMPAQGVTNYQRYPGRVGDFQMEVVGTPERILDSVLPHEVTHAVLATHFGRPLPRWADEGISTTVEHASEKAKHDSKLREFLHTRRGLPMNRMFMLKEYPPDMLPLYAQGYSVCRFLIEQQGQKRFIQFIDDYMQQGSWTHAVKQHYGYESLGELQESWLAWVAAGSGPVEMYAKRSKSNDSQVMLAAGTPTPDRLTQTVPQSYSAAQPQPEQGVGSVSTPVMRTGAASDWSPAKATKWR